MEDFDTGYYEGYHAYNSGMVDFDNPYKYADERYYHWYSGWQDAACVPS